MNPTTPIGSSVPHPSNNSRNNSKKPTRHYPFWLGGRTVDPDSRGSRTVASTSSMSSSLASTSTHTIHNNTNPNNLPSSGHFSRPSIEAMNGFSNSHPDHEQAQKTTQQQQHHESNKRLLPVVDGETNPHNDFLTTDQQHEPQHNQYEDALESGNNNSNDTSASSGLSPKPSFWQRWQGLREISGFVVNHPHTQLFVVLLIACNALMMGLATFDFVKESESIQNAFATTDTVFLVLFTIELVLQFVYHGWRLLKDAWLVFDLVIVVTSWVLDEWQIIRALRIFRALRLITRIKVMQNLVVALFSVMPRMFAIWLLLSLVSYIFAVMFTQLFKDLYEQGATGDIDYFGRMDKTFFTLFQIMTLDAWADLTRDIMLVYSWAWIPMIAYVIITGFVVVNLVIAVICDAVAALHDDEKAKLSGQVVPQGDAQEQTPIVLPAVREQLSILEQHVDALSLGQTEALQKILELKQRLGEVNQRMINATQYISTMKEKVP